MARFKKGDVVVLISGHGAMEILGHGTEFYRIKLSNKIVTASKEVY
jgi:hypothetical protein